MNRIMVWSALALMAAAPVAAQETSVDGTTLTITEDGETYTTQLRCSGTTVLTHRDLVYVACGPAGALVLRAGKPPEELSLRAMGGDVTGFFLVDDVVWAQVLTRQAKPVVEGTAVSGPVLVAGGDDGPATTTTVEPEAPPAPEGSVVQVGPESVVVDLGTDDGVKRNGRIEIFVRKEVQLGDQQGLDEEVILVGTVTAVSPKRAEVRLGVNERVPPGARARPTTNKVTSNTFLPPRLGGLWEFEFTARPFLALGTFGFGTISDATVRRRLHGPWASEFRLEPLGLGLAEEGNVVAMSGNLLGSYDTRVFAVGLGAGWSAINDNFEEQSLRSDDAGGIEPTRFDRVRSGLSIAQSVRLGSVDGMHLMVYNAFILYRDEFHYGGTTASAQFPVRDGVWFLLRGGGGVATGYGYGEIGLRVRAFGAGDRGTLFLTPTIGGGGLSGERDCDAYEGCVESVSYGGPLVGLGVLWRQ